MDIISKANFLKVDFLELLKCLSPQTKGSWGVLTAQQMIEHFADSIKIASGRKENIILITPTEALPQMIHFLRSEKPFKENTKNALMPDSPVPAKFEIMEESIREVENEMFHFFSFFERQPNATTLNPFFGNLTYDDNILLLHKHALHHLVQFGLWNYR
jgi:hypothetical protein